MDERALLELALRQHRPSWCGPLEVVSNGCPEDFAVPMPTLPELTLLGSVAAHLDTNEQPDLSGEGQPNHPPVQEVLLFYRCALEWGEVALKLEPELRALGWQGVEAEHAPLMGFMPAEVLDVYRANADFLWTRHIVHWWHPAHASVLTYAVQPEHLIFEVSTGLPPQAPHNSVRPGLPLPLLELPPGVRIAQLLGGGMSVWGAVASSQSAALLEGEVSLADLFSALRAQLEAAGWHLVEGEPRSSVWTLVDRGDASRAVLSLATWEPGMFYANLHARVQRTGETPPASNTVFFPARSPE